MFELVFITAWFMGTEEISRGMVVELWKKPSQTD